MGDGTISWTDATWNPTRGCRRISPGCENCYAERQANRFAGEGGAYEGLVKLTANGPRWSGATRFPRAGSDARRCVWCERVVSGMSKRFGNYRGWR